MTKSRSKRRWSWKRVWPLVSGSFTTSKVSEKVAFEEGGLW